MEGSWIRFPYQYELFWKMRQKSIYILKSLLNMCHKVVEKMLPADGVRSQTLQIVGLLYQLSYRDDYFERILNTVLMSPR